MASASSVKAGEAYVEAFLDKSRLTRGLAGASKSIKTFTEKNQAVLDGLKFGGAALAAGGILGINKAINQLEGLDKVNKMGQAFGLAAEEATGLFGIMQASGSDAASSMESLVTMSSAIQQALTGEGQGAKLLEGLNVSAEELAKLNPSEQFFRLHKALLNLEDPVARVNKLMIAFGEDGGKQLIGTLSKSNEELRRQAQGFAMTQEQLDGASKSQMAMNELAAASNRIWNEIAIALAPAVKDFANVLTGLFKSVSESGMSKELANILVGVTALGAGSSVIGTLVSSFGNLLTVASKIPAVLSFMGPGGLAVAGLATVIALSSSFDTLGSGLMSVDEQFGMLNATMQIGIDLMKERAELARGGSKEQIKGSLEELKAEQKRVDGILLAEQKKLGGKTREGEDIAGAVGEFLTFGNLDTANDLEVQQSQKSVDLLKERAKAIQAEIQATEDALKSSEETKASSYVPPSIKEQEADARKRAAEEARRQAALTKFDKEAAAYEKERLRQEQEQKLVKASDPKSLNSASVLGTAQAANDIARALAGSDASKLEKRILDESKQHTKLLKDISKNSGVKIGAV